MQQYSAVIIPVFTRCGLDQRSPIRHVLHILSLLVRHSSISKRIKADELRTSLLTGAQHVLIIKRQTLTNSILSNGRGQDFV